MEILKGNQLCRISLNRTMDQAFIGDDREYIVLYLHHIHTLSSENEARAYLATKKHDTYIADSGDLFAVNLSNRSSIDKAREFIFTMINPKYNTVLLGTYESSLSSGYTVFRIPLFATNAKGIPVWVF